MGMCLGNSAPLFADDTAALNKQAPGFQRMKLGDYIVTAIYDGYLDMDMKILRNGSEKETRALLARSFVDPAKLRIEVAAFVIDTGSKKIMVDAGAGITFGPTVGRLSDNLSAAGLDLDDIDAVLITHMHGDHIGGLLDEKGKPRFKNAVVYSAKEESGFWLSETQAASAPEDGKRYFKMAQDISAPYRKTGRWKTFEAQQKLFEGITALSASGHTPGHTAYKVSSGGQTLLLIGDLVHNMATQFPKPEISLVFDSDFHKAVTTRKAIFKEAAEDKVWVAAAHLPFPGMGKLVAESEGAYHWLPVAFSQMD